VETNQTSPTSPDSKGPARPSTKTRKRDRHQSKTNDQSKKNGKGDPAGTENLAKGTQPGPPKPDRRDRIYDLREPSYEDWQRQDSTVITQYYEQAKADFFCVVDDYLDQANLAAERYSRYIAKYERWRLAMILSTGFLALINIAAAFELVRGMTLYNTTVPVAVALTSFAALFAGALTVLGNIENFFRAGERAAVFRESHELLLNRYREYSAKWLYYVDPYGQTPLACMNAGRLYRQLTETDQQLRQKLKQLAQVQGRTSRDAASSARASAH
jgi:hypothetical protein